MSSAFGPAHPTSNVGRHQNLQCVVIFFWEVWPYITRLSGVTKQRDALHKSWHPSYCFMTAVVNRTSFGYYSLTFYLASGESNPRLHELNKFSVHL